MQLDAYMAFVLMMSMMSIYLPCSSDVKTDLITAPVCLLVFLGLVSEVSASTWTCQKDELTRQVVVFYPEAPARLPCKVFYAKPNENVLPRVLWEAKYTMNYCEHKAAAFIEKLSTFGWYCFSDDLENKPKHQ